MLVYEKNNKLNINFENSVEGIPDVSIGKDGDKTEILVDGQQQPSGGGAGLILVTATMTGADTADLDKTKAEIDDAYAKGMIVGLKVSGMVDLIYPSAIYISNGGTTIDYVLVMEGMSVLYLISTLYTDSTATATLSAFSLTRP